MKLVSLGLVASAVLLVSCVTKPVDLPPLELNASTPPEFLGVEPGKMYVSTQNWSDHFRFSYWHLDQGSLATPYDIALAIARADSEELFFSGPNIARYRYIPQNVSTYNPDALPLGFTKSSTKYDGTAYLGMTCSACHSTVVTYKGEGILIDGAPTMGDFQTFFKDLLAAHKATLDNEAKFINFANRVLPPGQTPADRAALKERLAAAIEGLQARFNLNATDSAYGYGRVDAVGEIFNSTSSANINVKANRKPPDAPVSYPFLWGTHQSNVVQWNGFAPNVTEVDIIRIIGPLGRNFGEVLGVFGKIEATPQADGKTSYRNSVEIGNLIKVEEWLADLAPPAWPAQIFGPLDAEKVEAGAAVYADPRKGNCAGCHEVLADPMACYNAVMVGLDKIGTDPGQAKNSIAGGLTGPLKGTPELPGSKTKFGVADAKLKITANQVAYGTIKALTTNPKKGIEDLLKDLGLEIGGDHCKVPFKPNPFKDFQAYKARPLNGIWATAPFLHNGSVPTLAALLDAPANRPETFTLGNWEFDPVNVGYQPETGPHAFTFDTAKTGNSNAGHDYGTSLSPVDKAALLEYLKSL